MRRRRKAMTAVGYLVFFGVVAVIITFAMLIYGLIADMALPKLAVAAIMLIVVVVLAGLCVLADALRRKFMVDRPVGKILEATRRISEGDFSVRIYPSHTYDRYDDYDLIMENINVMAAELSKNEVLRSDFISNVSHEIKTPIAVIQNYADALRREDLTPEQRRQYAGTLVESARRVSDLVVNILKLNKLEHQDIFPEREWVEVGEGLRKCILQFEDSLEQKQLELTCDIDDCTLFTDESFLEIVWNNLLSNAIKFTPAGGSISLSLKEEERTVAFSVTDTGCGMTTETGARIFDKFYQGDTSHSQQGNGLGLALVKKVVEILGGEIRVESEPGKGSTFTVRLCKEDA